MAGAAFDQSARRASTGLTLAARQAGTIDATTPAINSAPAATAMLGGSAGETP
jgi:hypothetical protein